MNPYESSLRRKLRVLGAQLEGRDQLIREAHKAGITKTDIHRLTGVARTTIDRILCHTRPRSDRPGIPPATPPGAGPVPANEKGRALRG